MQKYLTKIDELLYEKRSNQEKMILTYLKQNITTLPEQNLTTVADNNFCSPTSVTRIVKKLGFNGYRELQMAIALDFKKKQTLYRTDDFCDYQQFIEHINSVPLVYIYGKGASSLSAIHLFRQLIKHTIDCSLINEQDLLYSLFDKTIICISNSGQTQSVITLFEELKTYNNCKILAITKADSKMATLADNALCHKEDIATKRDCQITTINIIDKLMREIEIQTVHNQ